MKVGHGTESSYHTGDSCVRGRRVSQMVSAGNEDEVEDKLWAEVLPQMMDQSEATRAIKMTWRLGGGERLPAEKDVMREVIDALSRRFYFCVFKGAIHVHVCVCARAHGGINAVQGRHNLVAPSQVCMHVCMPVDTDVCMHVCTGARMYPVRDSLDSPSPSVSDPSGCFRTCNREFTHPRMHKCIHVCIHACVQACIQAY